jgi:ankyrin repeat protein
MTDALPPRPNLDWLRKTAKQHLQQLRRADPSAKLSAAQLAVARQYGLHVAIETGREDVVELLLAVDFGHRQIVTWLLQQGANVNARSSNDSHCTALHSAAWNGDLEMVELLVSAGADLTARDDEHRGTAREWAETAIRVTHNPRCQGVAEYLSAREAQPRDPHA